jgi:hypothetical protein
MKKLMHIVRSSLLVFILVSAARVAAQGTAFTYQGRLNDGTTAASGSYDLRFAIYDAGSAGNLISGPITNSPTAVSNGYFTVVLDFGAGVFTGPGRWLEIGVRTNNASPVAFTTLAQRQALTPSPYAIFANAASNLSGTVSSANLSGTYSGPVTFNNGANTFDGTFIGQFLGSTFTGGTFTGNFIGTGSGLMDVWHTGGNFGTTSANFLGTTDNQPLTIKVYGQDAQRFEPTWDSPNIIGGWAGNFVQPGLAGVTIGGGGSQYPWAGSPQPNVVTNNGQYAVIAGGYNNMVTNYGGAVLSGSVHLSGGNFAVIGGGQFHTNLGNYSVIPGGLQNLIDVGASYSAIGGGYLNDIQLNASQSVIGGGYNNTNASQYGLIGGGYFNSIQSNSPGSSVVGGYNNTIRTNSGWSSVSPGYNNLIDAYSFVSSIAGGFGNVIQGDSTYWSNNTVFGSSIAGGAQNRILYKAAYATIGAGINNTIGTNALYATIAGGLQNSVQSNGLYSTIGGGYFNQILSNAWLSTISGGYNNLAAYGATVPGGRDNVASGQYSFAAGRSAHATNDGSFVLTDNQGAEFDSTANNQLSARFTGGVVFETAGAGMTLDGQPILAGTVPSGNLSGTYPNAVTFNNAGNSFSGNGSGLTGVNASTLGGVSSLGFWSTTGNAGTSPGANYIGTSDSQPLLIKGSFVGIGRSTTIGSEFFGIQAPVSGISYGGMYINTASGTGRPFYGYALNGSGGTWHYVDGNDGNKWKLYVGGDRITVTTAGLVGIGTTTPDATLSVGTGTASKPSGGAWATFSDARLKKNVKPLEGALDRLMRLQGVTFEYKDPDAIHELHGVQIGMIAQEVEKIFPDWVDTAPNGMKRLSVHGFEALTVEALREVRKEKDEKISNLEKTAAELRKELAEARAELSSQKELINNMANRFEALERTVGRMEAISSPEFAETANATQRK